MAMVNAKEIQKSDIIHLESELNNLWGELNSSVIPHALRMELEQKLSECEKNFQDVLAGQASFKDLQAILRSCDALLAEACVRQAETELPKTEHTSSCFLALENIRQELKAGKLTPIKARHEVKDVMRHHQ